MIEKRLAVVVSLHELDIAQKISDIVVCVHGDKIEKYGTPEVFVIGGGGSGIPVYRRLARQGVPFAARLSAVGILLEA